MSIESKMPSYKRPIPPEWTNLVGYAESTMSLSTRRPTPDVVDKVWDAVKQLDNDTVEDARLYGVGSAIAGFAKLLYQDGVKPLIVDRTANHIVSDWRMWPSDSKGIRISDIGTYSMHHSFGPFAQLAVDELSPAVHVTADVLAAEADRRIQDLVSPESSSDQRQEMIDKARTRILEGTLTANAITYDATSAAGSLLRTILRKKSGVADQRAADNLLIGEVIGSTPLAQLNWLPVAMTSATLRRDEFMMHLESYVNVDDEGRAVFDRSKLIHSSELKPPEVFSMGYSRSAVLHEKRLGCPALPVHGLISMIVDIVNESVTEAHNQVGAELAMREARRGYGRI